MSLELVDLPTKVHPEAHAFLKASAEVRRVHINDLARQIIHDFVAREVAIHRMADQLCKSKGLAGISGDFK